VAKTDFKSIDEYIGTFPEDVQETLERIRATIREAVPEAEEVISYQIPAFKYHGYIFYFSAYANHYALSCPPPWTIFEVFKEELAPYKLSKSTIQFPKSQPVPFELIGKMSKYRANENLERSKK
jgi:uncharacterized protein YdhG (YjbR/CyaY superfamily)